MQLGDIVVVTWGENAAKTRRRVARIARLEPLGVQFSRGPSPGFPTASTRKFRPRWMAPIHAIAPGQVLRAATRRELVLGHPDVATAPAVAP